MKKFISLKMIFLYILIITSVIIIPKIINNKINYLSIGDSYAKGINSYGIEEYSYSDYLKDMLNNKRKLNDYTNYSYDEITINDLINEINKIQNNDTKLQKMLLKRLIQDADIITLSIGLNDIKYYLSLEDNMNNKKINKILEKVENNYNGLIKEIRKYYSKEIYVIEYPIIMTNDYYSLVLTKKFNQFLRSNKEVKSISINDIENDKNTYFDNNNSSHYNRKGYKVISNKIYKMIEKG